MKRINDRRLAKEKPLKAYQLREKATGRICVRWPYFTIETDGVYSNWKGRSRRGSKIEKRKRRTKKNKTKSWKGRKTRMEAGKEQDENEKKKK